jgi:DNA (cytosine-5)-methyltransferase 3A
MKVLSLFDGISAGQLALQRAGVAVETYYASEIDKYAISVTDKNFPSTIQLGDITKWREWDIPWGEIDLVIGGSPCQGFSFAGKQLNFNDERSKLFFVFVDICHRVTDENPRMRFMLENVRMKKEYQDVITGYFGVEPIAINSSLVSAQNRYRLYWTNIPNVTQPDDKSLLLKDILQDEVDDKYYLSDEVVNRFKPVESKSHVGTTKPDFRTIGQRDLVYGEDNKMGCLTATDYKQPKQVLIRVPEATKKVYVEVHSNEGIDLTFINSKTRRGRLMKDKSNCLTAANYDYCWYDGYTCRKLTPIECERLQTFPDNWTEGISNTQRYKALGNSWTVDVVTHIFKNL